MRKVVFAALGALAASLFAGPASAAGMAPPADEIVIDVVTANGSGCLPGTAAITVNPGNTGFTVTYSRYTAKAGVGAVATDFRKNCQLNVLVRAPQGYTYAISMTDHRGLTSLATGAGAVQRANHYFKGQTQTAYANHAFTGPMNNDWQTADVEPVEAQVWTPCGVLRNVNLNTELRVAAGTSDTQTTTSLITMESSSYHLAWASCP